MIHWEYIKGAYNKKSDNTGSTTLYTFMDFYGGQGIPSTLSQSMLPTIKIGDNTDRTASGATTRSAGYIITSAVPNQEITVDFILNTVKCKGFIKDQGGNTFLYCPNPSSVQLGETKSSVTIAQNDNSATTINGHLLVTQYLNINNATSRTDPGDLSAKAIYSDGICQAQYFNAFSDRRAKTNIQPLGQSVLPLVTSTQLYSFNYKDLDTPSIGIIAQDVQDVNFNGFSLVDNKEASGRDMDYMSIHESKLIYILWKAIQEQQDEIEELKRQLKKD